MYKLTMLRIFDARSENHCTGSKKIIASMCWANGNIEQGIVYLVSILQGKGFLSQGICL